MATKKDFTAGLKETIITGQKTTPESHQKRATPENKGGLNFILERPETKSKRVQLLVKPSVYDEIKKYCDLREVSVNDLINQLLEQLIKGGK